MAKYMWAIQGGVIVLSLICVPPYILATLAGFFAAHRLVRDRAARHARFA